MSLFIAEFYSLSTYRRSSRMSPDGFVDCLHSFDRKHRSMASMSWPMEFTRCFDEGVESHILSVSTIHRRTWIQRWKLSMRRRARCLHLSSLFHLSHFDSFRLSSEYLNLSRSTWTSWWTRNSSSTSECFVSREHLSALDRVEALLICIRSWEA